MNIKYKLSLCFVAIVLLIHTQSCSGFLEVEPRISTSDLVTIVDENSAKTAVRGIYNELQSVSYYGYNFPLIINISADNVQYTGSQAVNSTLSTHTARADLGPLSVVWVSVYNTINRANNVIAKVPELPLTNIFTETVRNQLTGEGHFLRALAYFDLVRTWGGVQLKLEPTISASNIPGIKRSSVQDSYGQILKDLEEAEKLLPETTNRIRATKKTVWALKARYYLYQKEWGKAIEYASKIINDQSNYRLTDSYNGFFANNASNTTESIFELYYNVNITNTQGYNWQHSTRGGIGWVRPSNQIIPLLNDTSIGGDRSSLVYSVQNNSNQVWYGQLYYRTNGTDPAYIIRLAELYLIRAEALAEQDQAGDANAALTDLNIIRDRANVPLLSIADVPAKADLLLAIENERRVEFAFEPHRWFDLVRTGRAQEVLNIS
ncbi:MAG TPA: RagB/SusD family nutrient uptake outer membrane protein, partial [Sphingobacterium sp.]|nr:RagB/SusD family nutrient uptake outer membrane protein [Sphingobacterium sp.]